jgi:hypothetical protein
MGTGRLQMRQKLLLQLLKLLKLLKLLLHLLQLLLLLLLLQQLLQLSLQLHDLHLQTGRSLCPTLAHAHIILILHLFHHRRGITVMQLSSTDTNASFSSVVFGSRQYTGRHAVIGIAFLQQYAVRVQHTHWQLHVVVGRPSTTDGGAPMRDAELRDRGRPHVRSRTFLTRHSIVPPRACGRQSPQTAAVVMYSVMRCNVVAVAVFRDTVVAAVAPVQLRSIPWKRAGILPIIHVVDEAIVWGHPGTIAGSATGYTCCVAMARW